MEDMRYEVPVSSSADAVWKMEENRDFTKDIWAQYKGMADSFLDIINYMNGHSFDDPYQSRQAIAYLGYAMPSLAYICPYQTIDLSYYLNLVNINLPSRWLDDPLGFHSENVLTIHRALAAGFYRMISGRDMYDGEFHETAKKIYRKIIANGESVQEMFAIETVQARFDAYVNFLALMALELHDKQFGTEYSVVKPKVLSCIKKKLQDEKTGMFAESYQSGCFGYEGEIVSHRSTWATKLLKASVNGLALSTYHYFEPEEAERAWKNYEMKFTDELLALKAEDIADRLGGSYYTQLDVGSEDLFSAILAAREMEDKEYFKLLQDHLFAISSPTLSEGLIFFNNFGEEQHMLGHFLFFARTHVPWRKLMDHDWESYYGWDYKKVR